MKEFFIENWQWIISALFGFIELLLLFIFKRKPSINFNGLLESVCHWILEAEAKFTSGSDKLQFVLDQAKIYLGSSYDESSIKNVIEFLLSLPQKKDSGNLSLSWSEVSKIREILRKVDLK